MAADSHQPDMFVRPPFTLDHDDKSRSSLTSLFDLVEFNARHNPSHCFCIQYRNNLHDQPRRITFAELHTAAIRCATWAASTGLSKTPATLVDGGMPEKARPVALLMASDITCFIALLALLRLGIPVLCMSARLAPQAVVHLLRATNAQAILVSKQLHGLAKESLSLTGSSARFEDPTVVPVMFEVPAYDDFLDGRTDFGPQSVTLPTAPHDMKEDAVILHSSGTTGLPKPISRSHAYLLGYAACHRFSELDVKDAVNVSTLPLFHGFGLLAPSLALSVGLTVVLPASTTIPTGSSTVEILRLSGATSLMTVPSILEDIYLLGAGIGIEALLKLRFVAVGGAPMKHNVAGPLAAAGVPILNHWGVTELGALTPIMVPDKAYDWKYLRIRDDIPLRFEPAGFGSESHRLVGYAPGSDQKFVVQDLLSVNPKRPTSEFHIAGRADDLIVLATGEKVRPTALEQHVSEDPLVKGALAFGDGKFQLGLILEAAQHVDLDCSDAAAVSAFIRDVWPSIVHANASLDKHAQISREMIIVTTGDTRPLMRTPKGSIPREPNVQLFKEDIEQLYSRVDVADAEPLPFDDLHSLARVVRRVVRAAPSIPSDLVDDADFFEHGMDSLQATMLRRRLNASMALSLNAATALATSFIYDNPTISLLCKALLRYCRSETLLEDQDRLHTIRSVAHVYRQKVAHLARHTRYFVHTDDVQDGATVLLTGSTGSLGSALLGVLAKSSNVKRIYALNRRSTRPLQTRQEDAFKRLGAVLGDSWAKIVLLEVDIAAERFGLSEAVYNGLRDVTHILHNAWPMDFNRSLTSFTPSLDATLNVVKFALDCLSSAPVRLLFSSSIAVVGRSPLPGGSGLPLQEAALDDPSAINHFGYAEAKWTCEQMFEEVSRVSHGKVLATSIRIGQIAGVEHTGSWNIAEHLPMIIKSCQAVQMVPILEGTASWIPVNRAAQVMRELLVADKTYHNTVLHLENPARQPWSDIMAVFAKSLGISDSGHFNDWLDHVKANSDVAENPSFKIIPFLESEFTRMATGQVTLDTTVARSISPTLEASDALSESQLTKYIDFWRNTGFIS